MRKVSDVFKNKKQAIRLMIFQPDEGDIYLFGYLKEQDGPADWDKHFQDLEQAYAFSAEEFGVERLDWQIIPDPMEGCQHDWINPVRIKGMADGKPLWGVFEALENGAWKSIP
jgi:hypothetical protein